MIELLGPIARAIKFVGHVSPHLVRWYYTDDKLRALFLVDIPSSGQGVCYNYYNQETQCWVHVTNLSPFDFTVERLRVTVQVNGGSFECSLTEPKAVKAGDYERIYVHGKCPMSESSASLARASKAGNVDFEIYVNNSIRPFSLKAHLRDMRNLEIM